MPIMFTVFMLFLPSGLGVYIFANIVLSLIQTAIQVGTTTQNPTPAAS
jgi:YidC/Oxa1 family membrane protein insertase